MQGVLEIRLEGEDPLCPAVAVSHARAVRGGILVVRRIPQVLAEERDHETDDVRPLRVHPHVARNQRRAEHLRLDANAYGPDLLPGKRDPDGVRDRVAVERLRPGRERMERRGFRQPHEVDAVTERPRDEPGPVVRDLRPAAAEHRSLPHTQDLELEIVGPAPGQPGRGLVRKEGDQPCEAAAPGGGISTREDVRPIAAHEGVLMAMAFTREGDQGFGRRIGVGRDLGIPGPGGERENEEASERAPHP